MKTGIVNFDHEIDPSLLPAHLAGCLRDVDANAVQVRDNSVTFRGGFFRFVGSWNVLVPFGFGDLTVDSETCKVRYGLSYGQLVISFTIAIGVMAAVMLALEGPQGILASMPTLALIWFLAVFVNLSIGFLRFKRFLRRSIATAPCK